MREVGIVFRDNSGTFWEQVDTELSEATIRTVRDTYGQIDLLFAMYASQNFDFFENRETAFPYAMHAQNLHNVLVIAPKLVVPASAGFRFHGDLAWLNRFLFPVSRQLFLRDLRPLAPELPAAALDPGDAVEIRLEGVRIRREVSEVAVTRARALWFTGWKLSIRLRAVRRAPGRWIFALCRRRCIRGCFPRPMSCIALRHRS